jgi:hypothetical protein
MKCCETQCSKVADFCPFFSILGPGKTTYMFSVTFRFLLRLFSVLPAGGGGGGVRRKWKVFWRERKTYTLFYPHPSILSKTETCAATLWTKSGTDFSRIALDHAFIFKDWQIFLQPIKINLLACQYFCWSHKQGSG